MTRSSPASSRSTKRPARRPGTCRRHPPSRRTRRARCRALSGTRCRSLAGLRVRLWRRAPRQPPPTVLEALSTTITSPGRPVSRIPAQAASTTPPTASSSFRQGTTTEISGRSDTRGHDRSPRRRSAATRRLPRARRPPQPRRTNAGRTGSAKCASAGCPRALSTITSSAASESATSVRVPAGRPDGDGDEPEQDPEHRPREPARELVQPVAERAFPSRSGRFDKSFADAALELLEPRRSAWSANRSGIWSVRPRPGGSRCPVARSRRPGPPGMGSPSVGVRQRRRRRRSSPGSTPPRRRPVAGMSRKNGSLSCCQTSRATPLAYVPGCSRTASMPASRRTE